jgi:beta-glucosidase
MGIHIALHPMGDLATEPRWSRIVGTFGEDAQRSARMTAAYVRGFQGHTVGTDSVLCMTKHFPGGGPQLDGHDPHFEFGREQGAFFKVLFGAARGERGGGHGIGRLFAKK